MNRTFNKGRFDVVIDITHLLLKWSVRALYVLIGILTVGFLVFLFLPKGLLDYDISNLENINVLYANIYYEISGESFVGIYNVKWLLTLLFFAGIANLAFYQYIQIQLRNVISNVKQKEPFSINNVNYLKYMAYAFLISSLVLPIVNGWLFTTAVNTFEIYEATINFSLNMQSLFMGILVLILAYVFDYGSYLQEEHDMTV